jgi:hypothetical protein
MVWYLCTIFCPRRTNGTCSVLDTRAGDTTCTHVLCAVDEHVEGHVCRSCDSTSGWYNARVGDDATGSNTSCGPRLCTGRYFVRAHDCAECPTGQYNPLGSLSTEADGACVEFDACAAFVTDDGSRPCRENGDVGGGFEALALLALLVLCWCWRCWRWRCWCWCWCCAILVLVG